MTLAKKMKLETEFMIRLLQVFEGSTDVHMPIRLIAAKLNDSENLLDGETDDGLISDKLVLHLLHLQDLEAIKNLRGECSWGYSPLGEHYGDTMDDGFSALIESSLIRGEFETPHCYSGLSPESVIRLTATGYQLRETLTSSVLSKGVKEAALIFGKGMIAAASKVIFESIA